jgi:succinate-semialdehyde dehydrogenase/glutarate-semialdehyde dehydrogenase
MLQVEEHVIDAVKKGGKILAGGTRRGQGLNYFEPTVISGVTTEMLCAREETFGPVAPVLK